MFLEEALYKEMLNIQELNKNIFPVYAPENVSCPYLVYQCSGGENFNTLSGYSSLYESELEIDLITENYEQLKNISKVIVNFFKNLWNCYIGDNNIFIQAIRIGEPREMYYEDIKCFNSSITISIFYNYIT